MIEIKKNIDPTHYSDLPEAIRKAEDLALKFPLVEWVVSHCLHDIRRYEVIGSSVYENKQKTTLTTLKVYSTKEKVHRGLHVSKTRVLDGYLLELAKDHLRKLTLRQC